MNVNCTASDIREQGRDKHANAYITQPRQPNKSDRPRVGQPGNGGQEAHVCQETAEAWVFLSDVPFVSHDDANRDGGLVLVVLYPVREQYALFNG